MDSFKFEIEGIELDYSKPQEYESYRGYDTVVSCYFTNYDDENVRGEIRVCAEDLIRAVEKMKMLLE